MSETVRRLYRLVVMENWYRVYEVEADSPEEVKDIYIKWKYDPSSGSKVRQLGDPEYDDDQPADTWMVG